MGRKQLAEKLATIRNQIAANEAEADAVPRLPGTLDEQLARAEQTIARTGARLEFAVAGGANPDREFSLTLLFRGDARDNFNAGGSSMTLAALCALFPERVLAAVEAQILENMGDREPISADNRRARLAELAAELHRLQVEEELIVRQLEADDHDVDRRADAPPALVLAADAELAAAA